MDLLGLSLPLGLGIAALGSGLGLGKAVSGAMEAMGRQPEAIGQIQTAMIIGTARSVPGHPDAAKRPRPLDLSVGINPAKTDGRARWKP